MGKLYVQDLEQRQREHQKTIGFMSKTTAMHVYHWRFLVHFFDYDMTKFCGEHGHAKTNCPFSIWTWIKSLSRGYQVDRVFCNLSKNFLLKGDSTSTLRFKWTVQSTIILKISLPQFHFRWLDAVYWASALPPRAFSVEKNVETQFLSLSVLYSPHSFLSI